MSSITITVAEVRAPAPGKKQASVIDNVGKRWGIDANQMGNYRQFGTYEILKYKESYFKGSTYYTIENAVPVSNGGPSALEQSSIPVRGYVPPSDDQRRMDIFVSVLINNSMLDPASAPEQELVDVINKFKRIWKRIYGPQPDPITSTRNEDLNDSIEF